MSDPPVPGGGFAPGDRVVVRFRKGAGAPADWRRDPSATQTDVTGVVVSQDASGLVVLVDGHEVSVPVDLVVAVRVLSDRAVRNSEIRALEAAAARGWPGVERATIAGWLMRAGGGYSRRANSAVPLERGAVLDSDTVAALRDWFTERGLPLLVAVVDRLIPAGHVPTSEREVEAAVMVRPVDAGARDGAPAVVAGVRLDPLPSAAWVESAVANRSDQVSTEVASAVLTSVVEGDLVFVSVLDGHELIATGRGAVTAGSDGGARWLGLASLWTDPARRGSGVGTAVIDALLTWGAEHGASNAYLQVEVDNLAAIRLYRRLGFERHHTYGYVRL